VERDRRGLEPGVQSVLATLLVAISLAWLYEAGRHWTGDAASASWLAPLQFAVALPGIAMLFASYFSAEKARMRRAGDWLQGSAATFAFWLLLVSFL
jgi:hypothetical protein